MINAFAKKCTKCPLHLTSRINCLAGEGTGVNGVMFVAEVPKIHEETYSRVLCGPAGDVFNKLLASIQLKREECYITHLVKCRPTPIGKEEGKVKKTNIVACTSYLEEEIARIKPKFIIPLGATSFLHFFPKGKISDSRGIATYSEKYKAFILPMYSPSITLKTAKYDIIVSKDFRYLKTLLQGSTPQAANAAQMKKYVYATSIDIVKEIVARIKTTPRFTFDIEATSLTPWKAKIISIAFSWKTGTGVCIPLLIKDPVASKVAGRAIPMNYWEDKQEEVIGYIKEILGTNIPKGGHNASYDILCLKFNGIEVENYAFDTILEHHLLDEEGEHNLDNLSWVYTDRGGYKKAIDEYLKEEDNYLNIPLNVLMPYNAGDADVTFELDEKFIPEIEKQGMTKLFNKITMGVQRALLEPEYEGVLIDVDHLNKIDTDFTKKIEAQMKELEEYLTKFYNRPTKVINNVKDSKKDVIDFNINSSKQLQKLLFEDLKLPPIRKTKTGYSTDDDTLAELSKQHSLPKLLMAYRKGAKLKSTYIDGIRERLDDKNRIHTDYKVWGTQTGRLSCLKEGTRINTSKGLIPIENIKVGNEVLTQYGYKKVTNFFPNGQQKVYRLVCDGREVYATKDHEFLSNDGSFKKLKDLKTGDWICGTHKEFSTNIECAISKEEAEFLGYLTGDGCIRYGYKEMTDVVLLAIGPTDKDLVKYFEKLIYGLYKKEFKTKRGPFCIDGRIMSTDVARRAVALGIKRYSHNKDVPEWLFRASREVMAGFIRGLFEADGCVSIDRCAQIRLNSVSKALVNGTSKLLETFGVRTSIRHIEFGTVLSKRGIWNLNIVGALSKKNFIKNIGFISSRKKLKTNHIINYLSLKDSKDRFVHPNFFKQKSMCFGSSKGISRCHVGGLLVNRIGDISNLLKQFNENDQYHVQISSIKAVKGIHNVYDIEVGDVHQYLVNTLICHNSSNPNLQNIPRDGNIKDLFIAGSGNVLIEADMSQHELRVLASVSKDAVMRKIFNEGKDIHMELAMFLFGKKAEEIDKEMRVIAKQVNFGIAYDISAPGLSDTLNAAGVKMTSEEAQEYINKWFRKFHGAKMYLDNIRRNFANWKVIINVFGRKRRFPKIPQEKNIYNALKRQATNFPISSSASDLVGLVTCKLKEDLKHTGAKIRLTVHDALVFEVPEEKVAEVLHIIKTATDITIEQLSGVPFQSDAKVGKSWGKLVPYKELENVNK